MDHGAVWQRIVSMEGTTFTQIRGGTFTHTVVGNSLVLDRTKMSISRSQVYEALDLAPLHSTVPLQHLMAPSYLFAIVMDPRVRAGEW